MTCKHKFHKDLQLQYVNWEVKTLFIGTFNPEWNECKNNYSKWFYGRTQRNDFWCILPKIYKQNSLLNGNRESWIAFCKKNRIAITDILTSIDADVNNSIHRETICKFKDEDLLNFNVELNNIASLLNEFPTINQICVTRQTLPTFWLNCFSDTIKFVEENPHRQIQMIYLRSPSRVARKGVVGNFCDFVANQWISQGYQL